MKILPGESDHLSVNEVYPRWAIYGFQLSPDGGRISFVHQRDKRVEEIAEKDTQKIRVTPIADLNFLSSDGGYPQPLTDTGSYTNPAVWSPDGEWLAIEHDEKLIIMAADGSQRRCIYKGALYHSPAVQANNAATIGDACWGYPQWSPDGKFILVAIREEFSTILRLVSVDGKSQRDLSSVEGYILGWDWSADAESVLFVTRNEDGWTGDIRVVDVNNGETRILWAEDHYPYQMPVAAWASNGKIVFRSNRSGWSKFWILSIDSEEIHPLTHGNWDDYAFRLSPNREQLVYASRESQPGSGDDLWIRPISGGAPARLTQHPGVNVPVGWAKHGVIYYWHSSPTEPGDLWSVSSEGAKPERLTRSAPVELERKLRAPQEIWITNEDGVEVPALIYLPVTYQDGERYPAVVWIHGGPTMVARYGYNPYLSWLANLGYVVIAPNYRGSIGHGVSYMNAVSGDGLGKNDLSDVLTAGKYAKTLPFVDLRRGLGVGGVSWGGYLTLMAVTQAPDDFSCAVAGAAISDWFIQQAQTEVRYYDRWLVGGWVYEQAVHAEERSPITFTGKIKTALFVWHGENDASVPFPQIGLFVEKARLAGADIEFVTYPLEGHFNKKPENQQDALDRIKNFLRRHLQPWNLRDNPSAGQVQ